METMVMARRWTTESRFVLLSVWSSYRCTAAAEHVRHTPSLSLPLRNGALATSHGTESYSDRDLTSFHELT